MIDTQTQLEYDLLTGLYSRWKCRLDLIQVIDNGENRVLCLIDVDNFKYINENFGTTTGDVLLKDIANSLCDTYPESIIYRISGDEFAILINPTTYSRYQMSVMTRNLFDHLNRIKVQGHEDHRLSFSIGSVFIDPNHHHTPEEVTTEATEQRHQAKKHEGNFLCSRYGSIPDVEGAFMVLREDRKLYNQINNRLFRIHDKADWINYLHEGASLKENMFRRNQGHLDDIVEYFRQGGLAATEYENLFMLIVNYARVLDAFMYEILIQNILIPYYEEQDPTDISVRSRLGHLYLLMADSLVSVVRMGDQLQRKNILSYLQKCMKITKGLPHDCIQFEPYFFALCELIGHYESVAADLGDINDYDKAYEELRDLLMGPDPIVFQDIEVYRYFEYLVNNARLFPIYRACYLRVKDSGMTEDERKELDRRLSYIKSHLVNGVYDMAGDDPAIQRLASYLQRFLLDGLSNNEIFELLELGLHTVRQMEYGTLSESNLIIVAYLFIGAAQSLKVCDYSYEKKRQESMRGLDFLIELLRKRESIATDHQILFLTQVMLRSMISSPNLTPSDKVFYLGHAMAAITLDTYSHSKAVATYANVILSNIIDNHPELLIGQTRPYDSKEELLANRESLLTFMEYACMLHDVGKMKLTPITSNAYRRLTDHEFSLIRRHPAAGVDILASEPAFEPFYPFIYTHHRWWNETAGYPGIQAWEKQHRMHILVDILSICDSLEAATSRIGRNYRNAKTFLQILDEFYEESGTRYSSEVLQSIISSQETYYQLRQMVDREWQNVYLRIFREMVDLPITDSRPDISSILPGLYQNQGDVSPSVSLQTSNNHLSVPQWMQQMPDDTLKLFTFSLMELNRMNVRAERSIIFLYNVDHDMLGFLTADEKGQMHQEFVKHYSKHPLELYLSKDGFNKAMSLIQNVVHDPEFPKEGEVKLEYSDKSMCLLASYTSVVDQNGKVLSIVGKLEDINATRSKLIQSIRNQNRYLEMFDALKQQYITAIYSDIAFENFEIVKGFPKLYEGAKTVRNTTELARFVAENLVDPEYRNDFLEFFDKDTILERLKNASCITLEYHSRVSGWVQSHLFPASYDSKSNITHLLMVLENVEDEHQQKVHLTRAAHFDALTGLYNRMKGEELIRKKIASGGTQIFAILDCDNFKRINDRLSHLVGDKVLCEQSSILAEVFGKHDAMRLGGDEFVVYINGDEAKKLINSFNGIQNLFYKFSQRISTIRIPELENISPTMSCGVVFTDGSVDNVSFEYLYEAADEALRESKTRRNGTVTISELRYRDYFR